MSDSSPFKPPAREPDDIAFRLSCSGIFQRKNFDLSVVDSQIAHYERNGFLIRENLLTVSELESIRQRMREIADGLVPSFPADQIEYEPSAERTPNRLAVRKINQCAERDAVFMAHAKHPRILDVVESLIGPDIKLFGSQCFMKPPGGIEKPYHQDSAYFPIEPRALVTCWTALDDATLDNGCLWVIPGSHRGELLDHDQPWKVGERVDMQIRDEQIDDAREISIELRAGSCSFHHSMLLHRSGPNRTETPRRGLAVHYMSSRSRWTEPLKPRPGYLLLRGQEFEDCV
ncbi:MAG TPA: phytanoyl-CoA dioxygenase family protein [Planctomycetaceae bacterium]|nr:phytanoyl-CoA dioxygenase family protein [Planctomycetaceae bacterium]